VKIAAQAAEIPPAIVPKLFKAARKIALIVVMALATMAKPRPHVVKIAVRRVAMASVTVWKQQLIAVLIAMCQRQCAGMEAAICSAKMIQFATPIVIAAMGHARQMPGKQPQIVYVIAIVAMEYATDTLGHAG